MVWIGEYENCMFRKSLKRIKEELILTRGQNCEICNSNYDLVLYHKRYDLGNPCFSGSQKYLYSDFQILYRSCNSKIKIRHRMKNNKVKQKLLD